MTKSRSPLWTIWPSLKWISVRVPPTCARSSTRSTAENWPRNPSRCSTSRCKGWLTVTTEVGVGGATARLPRWGARPSQAKVGQALQLRRAPSPSIATARPCRRFVQPFSFKCRRVADLIHETVHKSLLCRPEFGRAGAANRAGRPRQGVEGGCQVVVIQVVEKPRTGLISGGITPIWCAGDKLGEAPFKDFWSDDTKNN